MAETARPNFYLLLDLDPAVDDEPTIAARIADKKREWSKDRNIPKKAPQAKLHLSLLDEITALMADASSRRAEALAARQEIAGQATAARDAQQEIILSRLQVFLKQGGCTDADLIDLATKSAAAFTPAEVRALARAMGVPVAVPGGEVIRPTLDGAVERLISAEIGPAGATDLYDLLGHTAAESVGFSWSVLHESAADLEKSLGRSGKRSPETDARQKLAGIARSRVFSSQEEKDRYDTWLGRRALAVLDVQFHVDHGGGFLDLAAQDALLAQGRKLFVAPEVVREFIAEQAKKNNFKIQKRPPDHPEVDYAQCGRCGELNPPMASGPCKKCGAPLVEACPHCSKPVPTRHAVCGNCGCRTGDAPVVKGLLAEGQRLDAQGEHVEAQQRYARALVYWPKWKPLADAAAESTKRQARRADASASIEKLVSVRKLEAALAAMVAAEQQYGAGGFVDLRATIETGRAAAASETKTADDLRRQGKRDEAHGHYALALERDADYAVAKAGLEGCPPAPPTGLTVTPRRDGYALAWVAPSRVPGVTWRVLRRAGGRPRHADDGERVGELAGVNLEDSTVTPGTAWTYAVYAFRSGIPSADAAVSGPHLRAAEVAGLEVHAADGSVSLTWSAPPGARGVEVWRAEGRAPSRAGEGQKVPADLTSAQDHGVQNGRLYGYRVVVVYPDPVKPGGEIRTAGESAEAQPQPPPPPVTDLRAERTGSSVFLTWTAPNSGRMQLRRRPTPPSATPNVAIPVSRLDQLGTLVPFSGTNSATVDIANDGQTVFVPVTIDRTTAVVGQWVTVVDVADVKKLRARCTGATIVLTWEWPPNIDTVWVAWSNEAFPLEAGTGQGRQFDRQAYERAAGWEVPCRDPKHYYFAVFARHSATGAWSAGVRTLETMGVVDLVQYSLVVKKGFMGLGAVESISLVLRSEVVRLLPPLVLVARDRQAPGTPSDGRVVLDLPAVRLTDGTATIPVPRSAWAANEHVRLFFRDPANVQEIRLQPTSDQLRLG